MRPYIILIAFLPLCWASCGGGSPESSKVLLARVDDNYLYQADLDSDLLRPGMTHEDSQGVMQLYAQNWIRNQLLLSRANEYVSSNEKIERLVRDYRHSLITQLYGEALMKERLDSSITIKQYEEHYLANKENYHLDEAIVRCFFLRIPNDLPGAQQMVGWFKSRKSEDYERLSAMCEQLKGKIYFNMEEKRWIFLDNIVGMLPNQDLPSQYLSGAQDYVFANGESTYLMRVFEFAPAGGTAPLSFVMKDIAEVVLHQRKMDLMEKISIELYEEARNGSRIETFLK